MVTQIKRDLWLPPDLVARIRQWSPKSQLGQIVRECFGYLPPHMAAELFERITRTLVIESSLSLAKIDGRTGWVEDYGIVSRRVITTAGVNYLVDAWQNSTEMENQKYHGLGTGTTAAAVGDTALETELTTEYTGNTRATGSTTEGGGANVFRTVGTNTMDSGTPAVTEHGIFSAASAGTLWDRHVFSAINLVGASGDALQSTYDMTASSGG